MTDDINPSARMADACHRVLAAKTDEVGRRIEEAIEAGKMTGAAIAVAMRGAVLWEKGYGFADVESSRLVDENTSFSLASVTKPFTAAAVMTLVQSGLFGLDDPVSQHLPLALPQAEFDMALLTSRLLGGHAGGLPSLFEMYFSDAPKPSFGNLVHRFARTAYPAGERYEYANLGFSLLGEVASHVAGESFASVMETRIIRPMGLTNTFFGHPEYRAADTATRYDESGTAIPFYRTITPPSGELYASIHDLSAFAMQMMRCPFDGSEPILDEDVLRSLFSPILSGDNGAFTAFGWEGCHVAGERVIAKIGGQPGVSARLTMLPDRGISIAIVANRTDNQTIIEELTSELASIFVPNWRAPALEPVFKIPNPHPLTWYAGAWVGSISDGCTTHRLQVVFSADESACTVGAGRTRPVGPCNLEQGALVCTSVGFVSSERSTGSIESALVFRLIDRGGRLVGRCLEQLSGAGYCAAIPYIVTLCRVEDAELDIAS